MKTVIEQDQLREQVRTRYGQIARQKGRGCGCADNSSTSPSILGYRPEDVDSVPAGSEMGLGCGNPVALASIRPGETVVDLGSGGGFDCFLAAKQTGPTGRVIGVDMTPDMISKARRNAVQGGYANVEFRLGEIENLPVADNTADLILSNCVVNLSPDKPKAFREAFRVLKPGGRLAITDIVALAPVPESIRKDVKLYTDCGAGAALVDDVKALLREAGFENIRVEPKPQSREVIRDLFPGRGLENYFASATIEGEKPQAS